MHPAHVRTDAALADVLRRMEPATEIAIDCEFHPEGRYYPKLCLVQIAFGGELVAIDAFHVNLRALRPVLVSTGVQKLLHDGRQDLPILARAADVPIIANVFDTQIAAGFAGYGSSVGYGALVRDVEGVELDKSLQVSDWTRELSDAQIEYALDDVRHLAHVASVLRERLVASARLAWAEEACVEAARRALSRPEPEKLYRRVASTGRLSAEQLGVLREAAIWRDRVAAAIDKPLNTVANDLALKSIALGAPRDLRALDDVRGLGAGRSQPYGTQLLAAVARGLAQPEVMPKVPGSRDRDAIVEGMASVLGLARRFVSTRDGIAAELLADASELRALAEWHLEGRSEAGRPSSLTGWRLPIVGTLMLEVLDGSVSIGADPAAPGGTRLVRS